jgi:hyperosmotically inducible periplasmic protein
MRQTNWISGLAASLVLCATPWLEAATSRPDAWVTTKAKIALFTSEGVTATAINVDTVDGRVTLHGKVSSEAEKSRAGQVVAEIDGAREVRNLLEIVDSDVAEAVDADDEAVKARVEQAFETDPTLAASDVTVQSVNNGVVLLGGKTTSMTTHLRAITTAAGVAGVRRVASEVEGPETLADREPGQTATDTKTTAATRGVRETTGDLYITSATKLRLLANSETPALDINVDTRNGTVTLFGIVPTAAAKTAAEAEAQKVSGVRAVKNELQVVATAKQDVVAAEDADVEAAVEQALERRSDVTGTAIDVEVKNGVVRLTGSVPNDDARVTAATTARAIPGVKAVLWEDLRISAR